MHNRTLEYKNIYYTTLKKLFNYSFFERSDEKKFTSHASSTLLAMLFAVDRYICAALIYAP